MSPAAITAAQEVAGLMFDPSGARNDGIQAEPSQTRAAEELIRISPRLTEVQVSELDHRSRVARAFLHEFEVMS